MQITSSTNASLLDYVKSTEDSKSSDKSGLASLFQQSCVASNPVLTQMSQKAAKSSLYTSTAKNAQTCLDYLDTLSDSSDSSIFAEAEESGDTDAAVTKIESFVMTYNSLVENLSSEGGKTNQEYLSQMMKCFQSYSDELSAIGITLNADGSIDTDFGTLCDADVEDLQTVFGSDSKFPTEMTAIMTSVSTDAESAAQLAQIYSSAYSNSGSYSQYEFVKNFYDAQA